jgi:hypothetical protein
MSMEMKPMGMKPETEPPAAGAGHMHHGAAEGN